MIELLINFYVYFSAHAATTETSVTKLNIKTTDTVANRIKKFAQLETTTYSPPKTCILPRKSTPVKLKRTQSVSPERFNSSDNKCTSTVTQSDSPAFTKVPSQKLGPNSNVNNENLKLLSKRPPGSVQSRKSPLEKHLDTSSSFMKAAAFWNKM